MPPQPQNPWPNARCPRKDTADPFSVLSRALEERHMANLTFSEIRRGVQALSTAYVERRNTHRSLALEGRGKRAAFGFFYGTLHFLLLKRILEELDATQRPVRKILDLGCGTGVAGAAWALQLRGTASLVGIETHPWAVKEARWTYRLLGLRGSVRRTDLDRVRLPGRGTGIVVAFTANELRNRERDRLQERLLGAARMGAAVLVVEPIARRLTPWWDEWAQDFRLMGGVGRNWRFPTALPARVQLMDKAAGLDHRELTGRSLWLPGVADP